MNTSAQSGPSPIKLPTESIFQQFCQLENGWSDHYGAFHVASDFAGMVMPERYFIKCIWMHGCFGPWEATSPGPLLYNSPAADRLPLFVARQEEADFLKQHGYERVRAIGMPILYTRASDLPRVSRSLLIMPSHSLVGASFDDRRPFLKYVQEMKELRSRFDRVLVCVHPNCRINGLWIDEFSAHGFELVYGAQTNDRNALPRMRALFEQFESVTSNAWGSHLAYALAFGAKVSIYGKEIVNSDRNTLLDASWAANPATISTARSQGARDEKRRYLQRFYLHPENGLSDIAWGRWLTGAANQVSPSEMRRVLAQMLDPSPRARETSEAVFVSPKRRILFVSHEATRTGAPMFFLHFLRWLRGQTALEFDILLAKGGPLEEEFKKIACVRTPTDLARMPSPLSEYSLVYSNTCLNGEVIDALGNSHLPIITHLHELDCGYEWTGARRMASCIRQTDYFVACADAVSRRFQARFRISADRIEVHHEMIELPNTVPGAADALRVRYRLPREAFLIVGCGTFDLRKGVDLFVQAARQLGEQVGGRPVYFVWAGAFNSPDIRLVLEVDRDKIGMVDRMLFLGEIASPHEVLGAADIFWLTSREDPFPLAMLEAAALGKPVICFDGAGGGREFCDLGGGLTVPYLDTSAMAAAAHDLLMDEGRRMAMGARAAALVRERFTVSTIAPKLLAVIERMLVACDGDRSAVAAARSVPLTGIFSQWAPADAPQRRYVAAHLARHALRTQAAALARAGRKREAVQLLVKAVSADLASSDPLIICEGLVQIGEDLVPFDAKYSGVLLAKAAEVARQTGINLETFRAKITAMHRE